MKTTYHIDSQHQLVGLKLSGQMDTRESEMVFLKISQEDAFEKGFNIFVDMTDLNQDHMDYESIRREKDVVLRQFMPFVDAKIAGFFGNLADFGRGRQWESMFVDDDINIHGFMDLAPARAWLGLPDEYIFKFED